MKRIKLTQGKYAVVDDADYAWLNQWKWTAAKYLNGNFYAVRYSPMKKGKHYQISMARLILGLERGDKRQADHIYHNTLDNRRDNLRLCTIQQNHMNQKPSLKSSSRFKGVGWHKMAKKWKASIKISGKSKHLGNFTKEENAARAYDTAAIKEFGEFACLNYT